jgi:hypothetical protein
MDFSGLVDSLVSFAHGHPLTAIGLALCYLFLIYRRPKLFLGVLLLGVFLVGVYSMITNMASSGSQQKERLIFQQEEKQSEE